MLLNLYPAQTWFLSSRLMYPPATKTNSASSPQIYSFSSPILGELYPVTQTRSIGFFSLGSLGWELQESWRSLFALKFHHVLISLNFRVLIHKNENNNIHLGASLVAQMVENLPANAGGTGLSPGLGRSHMLWSN